MSFRSYLASASLVAALAMAGEASALTVSASPIDTLLPGEQLVADFDGFLASGYSFSLTGAAGIFDGAAGLVPGVAAPPPGTTTGYLALQQGGTATLLTPLIQSLSIYIGSPDSYNGIRFIGLNGYDQTLTGASLAAGAFNGDQSVGRRMTYYFGSERVTQVVFFSTGNSFELDNIAATSAVPEPRTWAMMLIGFAAAGSVVRARRRLPHVLA